jgi:hypothetical protein
MWRSHSRYLRRERPSTRGRGRRAAPVGGGPGRLRAEEVEELVDVDLALAPLVGALEDLANLRRVDVFRRDAPEDLEKDAARTDLGRVDAARRERREVVADVRVLDEALLVDVDGLEEVREGLEVAVVEEPVSKKKKL